jgi:HEAT repeat protein
MSFFLPPLPPKWSAALRDVTAQRAESRIAAARRLGQPVDPEQSSQAFDGLRQLTTDAEARVRIAAIEALGALVENGDGVSPAAVSDVLRERLADADPGVREIATVGLSDLGWNVAAGALSEALRSSYPEVRFQALSGVAQSGTAGTADQILSLLDDPDPFVRTAAVRAAGMIAPGTRTAVMTAKLRAALQDSAYPVRCEAGIALAEEGEAEAADALLDALRDPEHLLDALDVAPLIDDERVREKVAFMAGAVLGSRLIAAAAGRALARMRDPRGIQVLRDLLFGFRSQGRTLAVQTIGELRLSDLTDDLVRLSARPRAVDPTALAASLATLAADAPAAARALKGLSDRHDQYGEAARAALAEDSGLGA